MKAALLALFAIAALMGAAEGMVRPTTQPIVTRVCGLTVMVTHQGEVSVGPEQMAALLQAYGVDRGVVQIELAMVYPAIAESCPAIRAANQRLELEASM